MREEAEYEMREVIAGISGGTSCSGTWLAFPLTQALILQSRSFHSAPGSALRTEDVIGNKPQSLPTRHSQPSGRE